MAMSYYKVFRVPFWVTLDETKRDEAVMEWFKAAAAKVQTWPSVGFAETILSFKNRGWAHVWKEPRVIIPPQLLSMAVDKHVHEHMNPFAMLTYTSLHRINRVVEDETSYSRIFNDVFSVQDPIILSQAFQVAEICHDENKRQRPQLWISQQPFDKTVISKISDNIITIGEGSGYDINVKSVKGDNLSDFLSEKMMELYRKP